MAFDLDTQDVRYATQSEDEGKLYFLLIATPRSPPKSFHKKVIQPFLSKRGWKKISYKQTGFRALYFFHDQTEDDSGFLSSPKCPRCQDSDNEDVSHESSEKSNSSSEKLEKQECIIPTACVDCSDWTSLQRASYDRNDLKKEVENYKKSCGGSFEVHIVLSKPVNDGGEFLQIASQPGAID